MNPDLSTLYRLFKNSRGISTDSRNVTQGSIFFALKGAHFNGNLFATEALNKGASAVIVDDESIPGSDKIIKVDDALKTLQQLARKHRQELKIPVIGITGTNGKTTTKELIKSVLGQKFKTFASPGNLNNHIGVPLSVLSIDDNDEMAVIELGANHRGEIAELCEISLPDYGIITNIGKAHLEGFGNFRGVVKTKTELYDFIKKHKGKLFVNAEDELLMEKSSLSERIFYGKSENTTIRGVITNKFPFLTIDIILNDKVLSVKSILIGAYNFTNMIAAACIGNYFGVEPARIVNGLSAYKPKNNRSQWVETANNKIVLDAYNANPGSMKPAIENFAEAPYQNKVLILGDMLELGQAARREHQGIIDLALNHHFDRVILIGENFYNLAVTIPGIITFRNKETAQPEIEKMQLKGHTILIKGSRSIQLEKLLEVL